MAKTLVKTIGAALVAGVVACTSGCATVDLTDEIFGPPYPVECVDGVKRDFWTYREACEAAAETRKAKEEGWYKKQ